MIRLPAGNRIHNPVYVWISDQRGSTKLPKRRNTEQFSLSSRRKTISLRIYVFFETVSCNKNVTSYANIWEKYMFSWVLLTVIPSYSTVWLGYFWFFCLKYCWYTCKRTINQTGVSYKSSTNKKIRDFYAKKKNPSLKLYRITNI